MSRNRLAGKGKRRPIREAADTSFEAGVQIGQIATILQRCSVGESGHDWDSYNWPEEFFLAHAKAIRKYLEAVECLKRRWR